jgi:predicted TIM-barrel fold metal-dependent hydrolase
MFIRGSLKGEWMLYRRDVLKAGLLFLTAPLFNASALAKKPRRFIDVHCHFFNAADIPIRGFLERVVLSDYASSQTRGKEAEASISVSIWKGMVAKLADLMLKNKAPTPQEEMACLSAGSSCGGNARYLKSAKETPAQKTQNALADVLERHYQTSQQKSSSPQAAEKNENVDAFVDFVLEEMKASAPASSSKSMKSLGSSLRNSAESIAQFLTSGRSAFSRYFDWAQVLTDYRENIAAKYYSLYDTGSARLLMSAPALVDYNYWLEDQSPSPLQQQVELMGLLSLKQPTPMHGFVAFDPLRAVRGKPGDPSPLDIAKEAVERHGFLGVKLYSPMGFKPTGNADGALVFPAFASQNERGFGEKLDAALDGLYAWCNAEEVPILAHTTDSQSAGPDFAARAEPRFWEKVLAKYPKLKLNLAHFGNFSQAFGKESKPLRDYGKTWEHEIAELIKRGRYPSLYADISYFWWVLEGSAEKEHIKAAKKLFVRYFDAADPKAERLMFGTDWNMTGKSQGTADYVANVEAFFRDVGLTEKQLDNLFRKNALRFLGLNGSTKATRRLAKFYEAGGKPFPAFG